VVLVFVVADIPEPDSEGLPGFIVLVAAGAWFVYLGNRALDRRRTP
jgi:hypothetical protein